VLLGDEEDPPVLVEVGGGEVADDAVRHEQAVGGSEQGVRGVHDDGRRGGAVVGVVTLLSVPPLLRMMRPEALRTE
jgi:hypothetical protein